MILNLDEVYIVVTKLNGRHGLVIGDEGKSWGIRMSDNEVQKFYFKLRDYLQEHGIITDPNSPSENDE